MSICSLYQPKAIVGYFYMMLIMFFSTSTTLLTKSHDIYSKVGQDTLLLLYIWLLPGYILGAFICFWWFRWQRWRFRFFIAGGMACFAIFFGILYPGISPGVHTKCCSFPSSCVDRYAGSDYSLRSVCRRDLNRSSCFFEMLSF